MKTNGISSLLLLVVRVGITNQLAGVAKKPFRDASIHITEKQIIETIRQTASLRIEDVISGVHQPIGSAMR